MARSRMIKPEFWADEKSGMLSSDEKCLFIGMWNFADDEGLIKANPLYLKSIIFPYDSKITPGKIQTFLEQLHTEKMIFLYEKNKQHYAWIIKFRVHQRIDKPGKPQNPPPSIQNNSYKDAIFKRDDYICHICGEFTDLSDKINICNSKFPSIDHLKPKSKGGDDFPTNLKCACISCNKSKRNFTDDSENIPRTFQEHSKNDMELSDNGPERYDITLDETEVKLSKVKKNPQKIKQTFENQTSKKPEKQKPASQDFFKNNFPIFEKYGIEKHAAAIIGINKKCEVIKKMPSKGRDFNPWAWAQQKVNQKKHPSAIDETLGGLIAYWHTTESPWAYCENIIKTKSQNYNEQDAIAFHEKIKNEKIPGFEFLTDGMLRAV